MEPVLPEEIAVENTNTGLCINCNENEGLKNSPNQLCSSCREAFINYPVPQWIKLFAAGILLLMLFGLVRMPSYLSAAIHLSRAEKAIETRAFFTAQQELKPVLQAFPDHLLSNANMLIASAYNWDMEQLSFSYNHLADKKIDDEALYSKMEKAIAFIQQTSPTDTALTGKIVALKQDSTALKNFFAAMDSVNTPDFAYASSVIANELYDLNAYQASRKILEKVLEQQPNYYPALTLMPAVKRNQGDFTGALWSCDQVLKINREDIGAIAQKARIELKRKHDLAASAYATKAMQINPENTLALEALTLVKFFEGDKKLSQQLIASIQKKEKISGDTTISGRLIPVLSGKISYR